MGGRGRDVLDQLGRGGRDGMTKMGGGGRNALVQMINWSRRRNREPVSTVIYIFHHYSYPSLISFLSYFSHFAIEDEIMFDLNRPL